MTKEIAATMDRLTAERDAALAALHGVTLTGDPHGVVRELLEALDSALCAMGDLRDCGEPYSVEAALRVEAKHGNNMANRYKDLHAARARFTLTSEVTP